MTTPLLLLAALVLGYLLGSIPFGLLLTRMAGLGDIRNVGSGNIGATNVLRTGRKGLALATLLLDGAKGAPADMVLLDIERPYRIDVSKFRSKSKNSPYDTRPVQGIVLRTFVDGRTVFALEGERA